MNTIITRVMKEFPGHTVEIIENPGTNAPFLLDGAHVSTAGWIPPTKNLDTLPEENFFQEIKSLIQFNLNLKGDSDGSSTQ